MGIRHEINPIGAVLTETQLPCKVTEIQILAHGTKCPYIPIGRGGGLKIHSVWVQIPIGALDFVTELADVK